MCLSIDFGCVFGCTTVLAQTIIYLTKEVILPLPGGPSVAWSVGNRRMSCWLPSEFEFPLLEPSLKTELFEVQSCAA